MSKLLNREALLKKEDLKKEKVDLGNGEYVFVRQMTGRERDRFEQSMHVVKEGDDGEIKYERSLEDFRAKLAVNTVCDEKGVNILKADDYQVLSQNMSAAKLEKIINAAQSLNKITEEDKKALVKNSKGDQKDSDISESPKS